MEARTPGAIGLSGLREKRVALDIALRTKRVLRRILPGNRVYLTRTTDRYISLSRRTSFANEHDADIFISIHANSAHSRRIHGIETYLLSEASSARALRLAARESGTTLEHMSDLQKILNDLGLRSKVTESQQLARRVQQAMLSRLRPGYRGIRDLGVKRGPFYVLLGARMPSILVEVAFHLESTGSAADEKLQIPSGACGRNCKRYHAVCAPAPEEPIKAP